LTFEEYLDAARSSQPGPAKYTFFRDYCAAHLKPDEESRSYDDWVAVFGFLSDVYEQHKEVAVTEALKSYNYPLVIYYMEEASLSEEEVDEIWDTIVEDLEHTWVDAPILSQYFLIGDEGHMRACCH